MTAAEFEAVLDAAVAKLNGDVRNGTIYHTPEKFEDRVLEVLREIAAQKNLKIDPTFHRHAFPDIKANGFGIEIKTTTKDDWLTVGNSVFEGMRDQTVSKIYVVFAKLGGMPGVKWGRYEERITHVRISHAPRFVIEMDRDSSLFEHMKISYDDFAKLGPEAKMKHVRDYSRKRLKEGERLWWLEDESDPGKPIEVRLYMKLPKAEKIKMRAEGALLFPAIVAGSRDRYKYNDVAFFLLKYHNVFCPQTRDLYTAGSVAGKDRGGDYLLRSLKHIEASIQTAADTLPGSLFEEYWGKNVEPKDRIAEWLKRADNLAEKAKRKKPSEVLFLKPG